MQRLRLAMIIPALVFALAIGCGKTEPKPGNGGNASNGDDNGGTPKKSEPVVVTETGGLKGKVTLDGEAPKAASFKELIDKNSDKTHCLKGDTDDPTWEVGPDKGVANVVVWLRPTKGYFVVPENKREVKESVVIDQPFCRFRPYVSVVYPTFYDPESKKQKETGQELVFKNSAPMAHNTKAGGNKLFNPAQNKQIQPDAELKITVRPGKDKSKGGEDLININCDIHGWMKAYAWVFDHPYAAVTTGDPKDSKTFGDYEIKDAPAGVEVELVYWHPSFGNTVKSAKVLKGPFKIGPGETLDKNFTISPK